MGRMGALSAVTAMLVLFVSGCGGATHTTTVVQTVATPARPPVAHLLIARHDPEAPQHESGAHEEGLGGCQPVAGGPVKTIPLRSTTAACYRVAPRDRLLFVNETGIGPDEGEPNPVEVQLGDYRAEIGVGRSALFPAVGDYLRPGLHLVYTDATVQRPQVQVLPEGCSFHYTKPGEGLCFAEGAPPCRSTELEIHAGRWGAAAGTSYGHLLIVNRSARTCTVSGFPRVTAIDNAGKVIGRPLAGGAYTPTGGNHPRTIVLEPGAAATLEMNAGSAGNYPRSTCRPRKVVTFSVLIPGAGPSPLRFPGRLEVCAEAGNVSVGRIE